MKRAYVQYERLPDALSKNIYLTALHDRNEVLFYRLFSEHLREMIPIVNDLTVGMAMEQYHHECRRPRGVYLSIDHPDAIEEAFSNLGAGPDDIDLILATDAEQILGIGDWGVGGIEVSIGKLAIYTAAGGVDPTRVIPVMLDVGTNRENLLDDPTYIGNRHARIRGERYDAFIEAYVEAVTKLFPKHCCSGRTLRPAMDGASSKNIATGSAHSTMICKAPARSRWPRPSPRSAFAGRLCATSAWSSSEPARRVLESPTRFAMRWSVRDYRRGRSQTLLVRGSAGIAYHRHGRAPARLSGAVRPAGRRKQRLEA